MATEIFMPKMSDNMQAGVIISWLVQEGERVAQGQPVLEVESDKAAVELEAPAAGILKGIRSGVEAGASVPVGETIAYIVQTPEEPVPALPPLGSAEADQREQEMPTVDPPPAGSSIPILADSTPVTAPPAARQQRREADANLQPASGTAAGAGVTQYLLDEQVPQELAFHLYEQMVRIRKFEQAVVNLFARGKIPGFLHTYIGEEAVAVGVCANLRVEDKITSTHRGHGHMIAKGGQFDKAMAELYGKAAGYNKGKGGSMHIAEPDLGMLGANAIVSAGIPIASGAALTAQYLGEDWVSVAFFGDGASNEGAFHESLNLASVWDLPVVFVCENNEFAESTPRWQHQRIKDVAQRAGSYGIPGVVVDGNDVEAVYFCARAAIQRAREGGGPTLIEAKTTRWRGHHEADNQGYREKEELQAALDNDAIARWETVLLSRGVPQEAVDRVVARVEADLEAAIEFAERSPLPNPAEARADIFTPFELEAS